MGAPRASWLDYGVDGAFACLLRPGLPEAQSSNELSDREIRTRLLLREETGMTVGPLNHYQVLMLDPDVDADLLATVYRRLIQRYQSPLDKSGTALERLRALDAAYAVLSDPHRRARYDAQLEERMRYAEDGDWAPPAAVAQPVSRPVSAAVSASAPAPASAREAFSRATTTPQPVTRAAVPVGAQRTSSTRSVQVSVLDFGRYAGWTLRQLAARDPNYLEWLLRSPGGRQYRAEITALLDPR